MLRTGLWILLCCGVSQLSGAEPAEGPVSALDAAPPARVDSESFQLAVQGLDRPLRLQITCLAGGKPWGAYFAGVQAQYVKSLYNFLDADGNGSLSAREAVRLATTRNRGKQTIGGEAFVAFNFRVLDTDGDGAASFAEVESYLASLGEKALRVSTVSAESPGDLLFRELDADGDRRVTAMEASQLERWRERDRDGNQVLTVEELRGRTIGPSPPEFVAAVTAGGAPQGPLRIVEAALPEMLSLPVGIDVRIEFQEPQSANGAPVLTIQLGAEAQAAGWSVTTNAAGEPVLKNGRRLLVLRLLPPIPAPWTIARSSLLKEFAVLAQAEGSDKKLTSGMEMTSRLKALFALADLNGDDAVDETELTNCLDRIGPAQSASQAGQLRAVVFSEQSGLWPLVDLNRDGRISRRELQAIPKIVQQLANEDGTLNAENLPETTLIVLQRGPFASADEKEILRDGGPIWFNRADRNADGDLDRDEFPGTLEDFQRLDRNRDGWIDLGEALQADVAALRPPETQPAATSQEKQP